MFTIDWLEELIFGKSKWGGDLIKCPDCKRWTGKKFETCEWCGEDDERDDKEMR